MKQKQFKTKIRYLASTQMEAEAIVDAIQNLFNERKVTWIQIKTKERKVTPADEQ